MDVPSNREEQILHNTHKKNQMVGEGKMTSQKVGDCFLLVESRNGEAGEALSLELSRT